MRIVLGEHLSLVETDNLQHLSIDLLLPTAAAIARLRDIGAPAGADEWWIDLSWLRTKAADSARSQEWWCNFDQMIEYARRSGWISDDERLVKVHQNTAGTQ